MESETQKNIPPTQPLPQTPPIVPASANWSRILLFTVIGLIVAVGTMSIVNQKSNTQVTQVRVVDEKQTPTPPTDLDHDLKCPTEITCPNYTFCDYSRPGGMGPNGFVSGQAYGSQKCISRCQDDSQCPNGKCQTFQIVGGDIVIDEKGCVNKK